MSGLRTGKSVVREPAATSRRIFVGDVQGCADALDRLLAACQFDPKSDQLCLAGDLVRKGPDSKGVVDRAIELDAKIVLGNHDLRWLQDRVDRPDARTRWLAAQPILRIWPDLAMVHAGMHPSWELDSLTELEDAEVAFAVTVRTCDQTGRQPDVDWPPPGPPFAPWDVFWSGPRVVCGHWARRGVQQTPSVVALDSGCCYGRSLTAWIAEEDRFVSVQSRGLL
ncbi:MAG: metallophosphoesterase [Planctomycetota bacterium]